MGVDAPVSRLHDQSLRHPTPPHPAPPGGESKDVSPLTEKIAGEKNLQRQPDPVNDGTNFASMYLLQESMVSHSQTAFRPWLGSLLLITLLLVGGCGPSGSGKDAPVAEQGVLELRSWDFAQNGPVELAGEWALYWQRLLSSKQLNQPQAPAQDGWMKLPGVWSGVELQGLPVPGTGYATYRLVVWLPPSLPRLALKLQDQSTAFEIEANGEVLGGNGRVGVSADAMLPEFSPKVLSLGENSERLELVLRVSNFMHRNGGPWEGLQLGTEDQIHQLRDRNLAFELFLAGSIYIIALYHFGLFWLRQEDHSTLYFGLFCLLTATRGLLTGERYLMELLPLSFEWLSKLEYLTFYLAIPVGLTFVASLFPERVPRWFLRTIQGLGGLFSTVVLVTPLEIYSHTVNAYQVIGAVAGLYVLVLLIQLSLFRRQEVASIFLLGFLILFGTFLNDILNANRVIQTGNFQALGFLVFILSQAFLLSLRSARLYQTLQTLNRSLERFIPYEFLSILDKASILDVKLGDQVEREMSILFADIRSFTTLSEGMTPEENFRFINSYLSQMGPLIRDHHGFIDKYIGDAIMALFQNPEDAVQSGVVMLKKLEAYNEGRKRAGYTPIRIGVGVNTGPVILGMLGEENRLDGTVISDTVNLASRLEGLTKTYCTPLLVSGFTVNALEDASTFHTRHVGQATVKGKSRPVTVYEVLDAEPDTVAAKKMGTATRFEEALLQYEKGRLQEALEGFQECVREVPEDETAKVYAQRCTQRLSGEAAPPS